MREWYASSELAGLPGAPATVSGVIRAARRECWQSRKRAARGGGLEYHLSSLRAETRLFLSAYPDRVGVPLGAAERASAARTSVIVGIARDLEQWAAGDLSVAQLIPRVWRGLLALRRLRARRAGVRYA